MTGRKRLPPKDVMKICEEIIRGYERRKRAYEQRRMDIVYYRGGGFMGTGRNPNTHDVVAEKTERLEKLERGLDAKFLRAVEQSLSEVGEDVAAEPRERLRKAVLLNCESGRDYPYEMLNIDEFSRRDFYRRRQKFIAGVAEILGLT